jgi:propionyl-CoA synthetase
MRGSSCRFQASFKFNHAAYARDVHLAKTDAESFWMKKTGAVEWKVAPSKALSNMTWFPDGKLSTVHNCLDRHVRDERGGMVAIQFDSLITRERRQISYKELLELSSDFAR